MARGILRQWLFNQFLDSLGAYFPVVSIFKHRSLKSYESYKEINFRLQYVQNQSPKPWSSLLSQAPTPVIQDTHIYI